MVTFSNDDNGNAPLYYVAVTLSANDGNGFQQLINWNPSSYSSYLNTDCQNHNWQDGAGNLLDSWFETPSATSSSTSVYEWVVLPNSTATTIYLVFSATTASGYSTTHTGVQPNYSATYGQYDNGASVFPILYQNFAGTATPSGWVSSGVTIDNGITNIPYSSYIVTSATFGLDATQILDFYANIPAASSIYNAGFGYVSSSGGGNAGIITAWTLNTNNPSSTDNFYGQTDSGTAYTGETTVVGLGAHIWSIYWPSASSTDWYIDYSTPASITATIPTTTQTIGGVNIQSTQTSPTPIYWVRIRTYPPSGTMPTTTFGSVTPVPVPTSLAAFYFPTYR
jgi:hypothetical protein